MDCGMASNIPARGDRSRKLNVRFMPDDRGT
jgi:hypothetical protein